MVAVDLGNQPTEVLDVVGLDLGTCAHHEGPGDDDSVWAVKGVLLGLGEDFFEEAVSEARIELGADFGDILFEDGLVLVGLVEHSGFLRG